MTRGLQGVNPAFERSAVGRLTHPTDVFTQAETLAHLLSFANDGSAFDVDCKAEELIVAFGSLGGVLHATTGELLSKGLTPNGIKLLQTVLTAQLHVLKAEITRGTRLTKYSQITEYLTASMAYDSTERFKVLFLGKQNVLIADEDVALGTIDHVPVCPREVVKRALELNSKAIILAHNHPSGDPKPSPGDIEMTKQVIDACKALGIKVHDHIIIGDNQRFVSMDAECCQLCF